MSNPRRFGEVILYRVTESMPLDKAKREALKIRKSGRQARVDTYQGKYAVWAISKKASAKIKLPVLISDGRRFLTKTWLKNNFKSLSNRELSAISSAPVIPLGKNIGRMPIDNCVANSEAHWKKTGDIVFDGWIINSKNAHGNLIGHRFNVRNGKVIEASAGYEWTKDTIYVGVPISQDYDNKDLYYDSHFDVPSFYKSRAKLIRWQSSRKTGNKTEKTITLYHGTTSIALPAIKRSGKVIGYWSNDPTYASMFSGYSVSESSSADIKEHPVILVAKVPESLISKHEDDYYEVLGFNVREGHVKSKKENITAYMDGMKTNYTTAQLPIKYISYVLHIKRRKWPDVEKFIASDWIKKKI